MAVKSLVFWKTFKVAMRLPIIACAGNLYHLAARLSSQPHRLHRVSQPGSHWYSSSHLSYHHRSHSGPKLCSHAGSNNSSNDSGVEIHVLSPDSGTHEPYLVSTDRDIATILNVIGCGGGCLKEDVPAGKRVMHKQQLVAGKQYRGVPARKLQPSVHNITVFVHTEDSTQEQVLPEVKQSELMHLLAFWGAPGLKPTPSAKQLLVSVEQLSSGGTYHAVPLHLPLERRVS